MNYWLASTESTSVPVIIRRSSQKNDFQSSGNEEVENRVREVNVDVFGVDDTNEGDGLGQVFVKMLRIPIQLNPKKADMKILNLQNQLSQLILLSRDMGNDSDLAIVMCGCKS